MRKPPGLCLLAAALALGLPAAGCQQRSDATLDLDTSDQGENPTLSEAERTRLMEEKAAEAQRQLEGDQASARTEQEAEEAVRRFEIEMQELRELSADDADPEDPPPPEP